MSGEGVMDGRVAVRLGRGELRLGTPALAVAKPREGRIDLFVAGPDHQPGCCPLRLDEAARLHETLGAALALMRAPGELPGAGTDCGEAVVERTLIWGGRAGQRRLFLRRLRAAAFGLLLALGLLAVFILPALWGGR